MEHDLYYPYFYMSMDYYKTNFETWNKVAGRYEQKFMDLDLYNDTYDRFCDLVPLNANVLEIGCGPGNITRYIRSKRPDLNITAIDAAPEMVKLAAANNPGIHTLVMDCRNMGALNTTYDAIICGFVIPYLSKEDCEQFLENCYRLLRQSGSIYLSFIEGSYELSGYEMSGGGDKMYVHFYDAAYLKQQLTKNNFNTSDIFRRADSAGSKEVTTVTIIAQRLATSPQQVSGEL